MLISLLLMHGMIWLGVRAYNPISAWLFTITSIHCITSIDPSGTSSLVIGTAALPHREYGVGSIGYLGAGQSVTTNIPGGQQTLVAYPSDLSFVMTVWNAPNATAAVSQALTYSLPRIGNNPAAGNGSVDVVDIPDQSTLDSAVDPLLVQSQCQQLLLSKEIVIASSLEYDSAGQQPITGTITFSAFDSNVTVPEPCNPNWMYTLTYNLTRLSRADTPPPTSTTTTSNPLPTGLQNFHIGLYNFTVNSLASGGKDAHDFLNFEINGPSDNGDGSLVALQRINRYGRAYTTECQRRFLADYGTDSFGFYFTWNASNPWTFSWLGTNIKGTPGNSLLKSLSDTVINYASAWAQTAANFAVNTSTIGVALRASGAQYAPLDLSAIQASARNALTDCSGIVTTDAVMIPSQAFQRLSQGPIFGHSTAVFPSGGVNCGESNYTLWWKLEYVQDVPNSRRSLLSRFSDPFNKWTGQSHPVIPPAWPESPPVRRDGSPSYSAQVESPSSPVDDDSKSSSAVDGPTMTTVLPSSVPTTLLGLNSSAVQFDTSAMPSAVKTCGGIRSFSLQVGVSGAACLLALTWLSLA